ncbi:hypothetical protein ACFRFD_39360, partial [Streptomyces sp. NPDC056632]
LAEKIRKELDLPKPKGLRGGMRQDDGIPPRDGETSAQGATRLDPAVEPLSALARQVVGMDDLDVAVELTRLSPDVLEEGHVGAAELMLAYFPPGARLPFGEAQPRIEFMNALFRVQFALYLGRGTDEPEAIAVEVVRYLAARYPQGFPGQRVQDVQGVDETMPDIPQSVHTDAHLAIPGTGDGSGEGGYDPVPMDSQEQTAGTLAGDSSTGPMLSQSGPFTGDLQWEHLSPSLFEPDGSFFSDDYAAEFFGDTSMFDLALFAEEKSAGLPVISEEPFSTTPTSTSPEFTSLSTAGGFGDSHDTQALEQSTAHHGEAGNSSRTTGETQTHSSPEPDGGDSGSVVGLSGRFFEDGAFMLNDWTEEADWDPFALVQGFEAVLQDSPLHPTSFASPGATASPASPFTGTGSSHLPGQSDSPDPQPQLREEDNIRDNGGLFEQAPQDLADPTADDAADAGIWQTYLDELLQLSADKGVSESQDGLHQAVQVLRSMVADTFFGGPFEEDIAAAHPLLLQYSPAYHTHFTAFQHHTFSMSTGHEGNSSGHDSGSAVPPAALDPALRNHWTALATRQPSAPATPLHRHTGPLDGQADPLEEQGSQVLQAGRADRRVISAGDWTTEPIDHVQDMDEDADVDGGQSHNSEYPPASTPHRGGRAGAAEAMELDGEEPGSPETNDDQDVGSGVRPSVWERYLAEAMTRSGGAGDRLRGTLQGLIDGSAVIGRAVHNVLNELSPGYKRDIKAFARAHARVSEQAGDGRAAHLASVGTELGLDPDLQAYWTAELDNRTARSRTQEETPTPATTTPVMRSRKGRPRAEEDGEQFSKETGRGKRRRILIREEREVTREEWDSYRTALTQEARMRAMLQRFDTASKALGSFRAYKDYINAVNAIAARKIPDWHLTDDAMDLYRHWIKILAHTPHGLNRTATELGDMLNPGMPLTEQAVHQLLTDTGHTLGPRTHIPGHTTDTPHTTVEQALTDAGLPLHDTDNPQELTPTGHLLISHWATHLTTTHPTHPTPHTPETAHTIAHTIAHQLANNPDPYIPSLTQWLLPPPTQAPTPTTQAPTPTTTQTSTSTTRATRGRPRGRPTTRATRDRPTTRVPQRTIPAPQRTTPAPWPELPASLAVGPAFQKLRNTVDAFTRNPSRQLTTDNARAETVLLMSLGRTREDKPVKSAAYIGYLAVDSVDYIASMRIMGMFVAGGAPVNAGAGGGISFRKLKDVVDLKGSQYQKDGKWVNMSSHQLSKWMWGQGAKQYVVSGVWAMMDWYTEGVFKVFADAVVEIAGQLQSVGMAVDPRNIAKLIWRDGRAIDEQAVMVDAILREWGVIEGHNPPPDGHVFYGRTVRVRPDRRTRAVIGHGIQLPLSGVQQGSKLEHIKNIVKEFKYNRDERLHTDHHRAATALLISLKRTVGDSILTRHQYVSHLTALKRSDYLLQGMFAAAGVFMLRRKDDALDTSQLKSIMALKGKAGKNGIPLTPRDVVSRIWGPSLSDSEIRHKMHVVAGIWAMMNWDDGGIFQALADAVVEIFARLKDSEHTLDERERTIARNIWGDHRALDDQAVIVHAILRAKGMVQDEEPPAAVVQQISSQTTGPTLTGSQQQPGSPTLYDQVAQYYSQLEQPVMPLPRGSKPAAWLVRVVHGVLVGATKGLHPSAREIAAWAYGVGVEGLQPEQVLHVLGVLQVTGLPFQDTETAPPAGLDGSAARGTPGQMTLLLDKVRGSLTAGQSFDADGLIRETFPDAGPELTSQARGWLRGATLLWRSHPLAKALAAAVHALTQGGTAMDSGLIATVLMGGR